MIVVLKLVIETSSFLNGKYIYLHLKTLCQIAVKPVRCLVESVLNCTVMELLEEFTG